MSVELGRGNAITSDHRRSFLRNMLALASAPAAFGRPGRPLPPNETALQRTAYQIRLDAALFQSQQPARNHPNNGDETSLSVYIGSFTKGLPHTQLGEVEPGTYETLLHALSTGQQSDFESLDRGSGARFVDPLAGFAFQMEGADSHQLVTPLPPSFSSPDIAGEMVELYWQALMRDVPFTDYATSQIAPTAIQDLNGLSAFHGPALEGKVTPATLFRGSVAGGLDGPYISQFFWQPVPVVSTVASGSFATPKSRTDASEIMSLPSPTGGLPTTSTRCPVNELSTERSGCTRIPAVSSCTTRNPKVGLTTVTTPLKRT
jgi:hypothetical protein